MELSSDGKIKCDRFRDLTSVDCVSLMGEDCGNCVLYLVHKDLKEGMNSYIGEEVSTNVQ